MDTIRRTRLRRHARRHSPIHPLSDTRRDLWVEDGEVLGTVLALLAGGSGVRVLGEDIEGGVCAGAAQYLEDQECVSVVGDCALGVRVLAGESGTPTFYFTRQFNGDGTSLIRCAR